MHDSSGTRHQLEERLVSKQKDIVERLSSLKSDLTRNPVVDLAKSHPLATVGAALIAGLAVGLLLRRGRGSVGTDPELVADLITERVLAQIPVSGQNSFSPEELRRLVRAEAIASMSAVPAPVRAPSFLGQLLGTVGRNLMLEGVHYVVNSLARHLPAED